MLLHIVRSSGKRDLIEVSQRLMERRAKIIARSSVLEPVVVVILMKPKAHLVFRRGTSASLTGLPGS